MDHAFVNVLEVLEVVVVFLLEFLGDGDSLLDQTRDVVQYDEFFQQVDRAVAGVVGDLELWSQLRAVVEFSEGRL